MAKCAICGSTEFFKDAGYYFCLTCQTQSQDIREEVLEVRIDPTTRLRKTKVQEAKSDKAEAEVIAWTSWELYNFTLLGLTNELIQLGAAPNIKLTVLQLWTTYLQKLEVAFISTTSRCVPKLARKFNKRDAEIIYGKLKTQKKRKKQRKNDSSATPSITSGFDTQCSSTRELNKTKKIMAMEEYKRFVESQASSERDTLSLYNQSLYSLQSGSGNSASSTRSSKIRVRFSAHAKKEAKKVSGLSKKLPKLERMKYKESHATQNYKTGPYIITPMRLWAILYMALRIHKQPIHLGDMLRYGKEGHLSYHKLEHLLPPEVSLTKYDVNLLSPNMEVTHRGMRRLTASMAKFLGVWELTCPDFFPLISRYCEELELPRGILLYTERMMALSPPKMVFNKNKYFLPNYEGRAMACIIVILKMLFGLDGVTEYEIRMNGPCIIVHGDDTVCHALITVERLISCKKAACNGYAQLVNRKSSIDAVEAALWWLECDEFFNCGYGSALNEIGNAQMDACIVDGLKIESGSVAAVSNVEHPISLAKYILEHFPNTIVIGERAETLAKSANINWLSRNSIISPAAYLAFESASSAKLRTKVDTAIKECVRMLQSSQGSVGCIAWDGCRIAVGTTTGGKNKKVIGRLGSSPIFGADIFANENIGCSLTGHGDSILKYLTARTISENMKRNCSPLEALKKEFDEMLAKTGHVGGGVILEKNGSWDVYFTSENMPYVVIKDELITFGTVLNEKKTEVYRPYHAEAPSEKGILDAKLFSFREWQRYIECRKAVLIELHFPTKLKYAPHLRRVNSLYIKFLEHIHSKNEREESEILNSKHYIPRDLASAMKQCVLNLDNDNIPLEEPEIFLPSLTPLHSYIQQLVDHPRYELPSILEHSFFATKVGYITRPEALVQLAAQCNIDLEVIDKNLHFVEKLVPDYEPRSMPSLKELKKVVKIQKVVSDEIYSKNENFYDFIDKKTPCVINLDEEKRTYYDATRESVNNVENFEDDFGFEDVYPDGRLLIPTDSDSESDDSHKDYKDLKDISMKLLDSKFCKKYNLELSESEKESIRNKGVCTNLKQKLKPVLGRNSKGQFAKTKDKLNFLGNVKGQVSKQEQLSGKKLPKNVQKDIFAVDHNVSNHNLISDEHVLNLSDISILEEDDDKKDIDIKFHKDNDTLRERVSFFRPFKDYWMNHCVFSRVKPKKYALFEKSLPVNFRWLLRECAHTIEMSSYDLYEEVCLVEYYFTYVLKPDSIKTTNLYKTIDKKRKTFRNNIVNKW